MTTTICFESWIKAIAKFRPCARLCRCEMHVAVIIVIHSAHARVLFWPVRTCACLCMCACRPLCVQAASNIFTRKNPNPSHGLTWDRAALTGVYAKQSEQKVHGWAATHTNTQTLSGLLCTYSAGILGLSMMYVEYAQCGAVASCTDTHELASGWHCWPNNISWVGA